MIIQLPLTAPTPSQAQDHGKALLWGQALSCPMPLPGPYYIRVITTLLSQGQDKCHRLHFTEGKTEAGSPRILERSVPSKEGHCCGQLRLTVARGWRGNVWSQMHLGLREEREGPLLSCPAVKSRCLLGVARSEEVRNTYFRFHCLRKMTALSREVERVGKLGSAPAWGLGSLAPFPKCPQSSFPSPMKWERRCLRCGPVSSHPAFPWHPPLCNSEAISVSQMLHPPALHLPPQNPPEDPPLCFGDRLPFLFTQLTHMHPRGPSRYRFPQGAFPDFPIQVKSPRGGEPTPLDFPTRSTCTQMSRQLLIVTSSPDRARQKAGVGQLWSGIDLQHFARCLDRVSARPRWSNTTKAIQRGSFPPLSAPSETTPGRQGWSLVQE